MLLLIVLALCIGATTALASGFVTTALVLAAAALVLALFDHTPIS